MWILGKENRQTYQPLTNSIADHVKYIKGKFLNIPSFEDDLMSICQFENRSQELYYINKFMNEPDYTGPCLYKINGYIDLSK